MGAEKCQLARAPHKFGINVRNTRPGLHFADWSTAREGERQLQVVPANVYGYASTVAYSLHRATDAEAGTGPFLANLASASCQNPLVLLIVSMVVGALFGFVSGKLAGALTKESWAASSSWPRARIARGHFSFPRQNPETGHLCDRGC